MIPFPNRVIRASKLHVLNNLDNTLYEAIAIEGKVLQICSAASSVEKFLQGTREKNTECSKTRIDFHIQYAVRIEYQSEPTG